MFSDLNTTTEDELSIIGHPEDDDIPTRSITSHSIDSDDLPLSLLRARRLASQSLNLSSHPPMSPPFIDVESDFSFLEASQLSEYNQDLDTTTDEDRVAVSVLAEADYYAAKLEEVAQAQFATSPETYFQRSNRYRGRPTDLLNATVITVTDSGLETNGEDDDQDGPPQPSPPRRRYPPGPRTVPFYQIRQQWADLYAKAKGTLARMKVQRVSCYERWLNRAPPHVRERLLQRPSFSQDLLTISPSPSTPPTARDNQSNSTTSSVTTLSQRSNSSTTTNRSDSLPIPAQTPVADASVQTNPDPRDLTLDLGNGHAVTPSGGPSSCPCHWISNQNNGPTEAHRLCLSIFENLRPLKRARLERLAHAQE